MNVLLVGPITDKIKQDWRMFQNYKMRLEQDHGLSVFNPIQVIIEYRKSSDKPDRPEASLISQNDWRWLSDLQSCLVVLVFCDAIYLLPGWQTCSTALMIFLAAQKLGLKLLPHDQKGELVASEFDFCVEKLVVGASDSKVEPAEPKANRTEAVKQDPDTDAQKPRLDESPGTSLDSWFERQF